MCGPGLQMQLRMIKPWHVKLCSERLLCGRSCPSRPMSTAGSNGSAKKTGLTFATRLRARASKIMAALDAFGLSFGRSRMAIYWRIAAGEGIVAVESGVEG
jgi:hypothetical protein